MFIAHHSQLESLCPGFCSHHNWFKSLDAFPRFCIWSNLGPLVSTDHVHSSVSFLFFAHVSLQVASISATSRRQVGNASVYLRLLLRPPRPLSTEKEEKEETRGAAARLRDCGLTIWDWKYTWVYPKKIFVSPQQISRLILRDYFLVFSGVVLSEGKWDKG